MIKMNSRRHFLRHSALLAGAAFVPAARASSPSPVSRSPARSDPPADAAWSEIHTLADAEAMAAERVLPAHFAYVQGGAGDEHTIRWNHEKFQEIRLSPRMLRDLGTLDTRLTLLGSPMACPVLFAPTASNGIMHPEGELAVAAAAARTETTYVLSTLSNTPVEEVARATPSPLWFQLYVQYDLPLTKDLITRAEEAGARVICITIDSPVPGARNREERAGFRLPPHLGLPHVAKRREGGRFTLDRVVPTPFVWAEVEALIAHARVPVVLKGVMYPADALRGIAAGAAGLIVSNHGGRGLDTVPATIEVLPAIAAAVAGQVPLLLDGGVRRGTDIVKALALGAQAVLIGRPYLHGLAVGGADGVAHVQRILLRELRLAMALLGCANLAAIDHAVIWPNASASGAIEGQRLR
jgi:4-hydroxymandelate oxidase